MNTVQKKEELCCNIGYVRVTIIGYSKGDHNVGRLRLTVENIHGVTKFRYVTSDCSTSAVSFLYSAAAERACVLRRI
jgi:hypothetical protein